MQTYFPLYVYFFFLTHFEKILIGWKDRNICSRVHFRISLMASLLGTIIIFLFILHQSFNLYTNLSVKVYMFVCTHMLICPLGGSGSFHVVHLVDFGELKRIQKQYFSNITSTIKEALFLSYFVMLVKILLHLSVFKKKKKVFLLSISINTKRNNFAEYNLFGCQYFFSLCFSNSFLF